MVNRPETADEDTVLQRALNILSIREHSTEELRRKLDRRGFPDGVVGVVLSKLKGTGVLDDARFSEAFVREKIRHKQMGRKGLFIELRKRGIDKDVARGAIGSVMEEEGVDERDLAQRLMERKSSCQIKKIENLLRRRGFDENIIQEILPDRDHDL